MSGDITPYTDLITSQHAVRPNYMATIAALVQPIADEVALLKGIPAGFDLDAAVGEQLDFVGQWVGQSRYLQLPITNVFFSWGVEGLGWAQGSWQGQFDTGDVLSALPDDAYRTLLRAKIAANHWDGTVPSAETIWDQLFLDEGFTIQIIDTQNMSMSLVLVGAYQPDAITQALFLGGYLDMKPVGVAIASRTVSVVCAPPAGLLNAVCLGGASSSIAIRGTVGAASISGKQPVLAVGAITTRQPSSGGASVAGVAATRSYGAAVFPFGNTASISGKQPVVI